VEALRVKGLQYVVEQLDVCTPTIRRIDLCAQLGEHLSGYRLKVDA
jgi:hypothetical protein